MTFPYLLHLGPVQIHPHLFFEGLAYFAGLFLYLRNPDKNPNRFTGEQRVWLATSALVGAALGSKILFWFCDPALSLASWRDPFYLMGGKTIVGGLLGGLLAVEFAKKRLGITQSTGDAFVPSLLWGTMLGRVGCFLTGLSDHTYGNPTLLPWGVNFGDGVSRHPTQLYEILWLACLGLGLWKIRKSGLRPGDLFKFFMVGYLSFRLGVELLKPGVFLAGLTAIQWACVMGLAYYARHFFTRLPLAEGSPS